MNQDLCNAFDFSSSRHHENKSKTDKVYEQINKYFTRNSISSVIF